MTGNLDKIISEQIKKIINEKKGVYIDKRKVNTKDKQIGLTYNKQNTNQFSNNAKGSDSVLTDKMEVLNGDTYIVPLKCGIMSYNITSINGTDVMHYFKNAYNGKDRNNATIATIKNADGEKEDFTLNMADTEFNAFEQQFISKINAVVSYWKGTYDEKIKQEYGDILEDKVYIYPVKSSSDFNIAMASKLNNHRLFGGNGTIVTMSPDMLAKDLRDVSVDDDFIKANDQFFNREKFVINKERPTVDDELPTKKGKMKAGDAKNFSTPMTNLNVNVAERAVIGSEKNQKKVQELISLSKNLYDQLTRNYKNKIVLNIILAGNPKKIRNLIKTGYFNLTNFIELIRITSYLTHQKYFNPIDRNGPRINADIEPQLDKDSPLYGAIGPGTGTNKSISSIDDWVKPQGEVLDKEIVKRIYDNISASLDNKEKKGLTSAKNYIERDDNGNKITTKYGDSVIDKILIGDLEPTPFQIKKLGNNLRMGLKKIYRMDDLKLHPGDDNEDKLTIDKILKLTPEEISQYPPEGQKIINDIIGAQNRIVIIFDDNVSGGATLSDVCRELKEYGMNYLIPITFGQMEESTNMYGADSYNTPSYDSEFDKLDIDRKKYPSRYNYSSSHNDPYYNMYKQLWDLSPDDKKVGKSQIKESKFAKEFKDLTDRMNNL